MSDYYNKIIEAKSNASAPIPKIDPLSTFLKYRTSEEIKSYTDILNKDIYPSDFFNVQNPQAIYTEIDIKTNKDNGWVSLSSEQNNFFKDLKIEDSDGAKKFTLSLFDRDFYNLEELIAGTVAFSQTSYNNLEEKATEYTKNAISVKSELTPQQINEIFEERKKILNSVLLKRTSIESSLLKRTSIKSIDSSVCLTKYDWTNCYQKDNTTSAKLALAILYYFCKVYKGYIQLKEEEVIERFRKKTSIDKEFNLETDNILGLSTFESPKIKDFVVINYKTIKESLSVSNNTKFLTEEILLDYFYNFSKYLGVKGGRNVYDVSSTYYEYIYYTSKARDDLSQSITNINNHESALIKNNADKVEATNKVIQLIETKNEVQPNIRIRFGYTDQNYGGDKSGFASHYAENASELGTVKVKKEDSSNKEIAFLNRMNTKYTMIRGPYYNFMITGVQSKIAKEGLYYTLTGFSMSSMKFDKFKLVQKFAKLKGTAAEILAGLFITFNEKLETKKDTTTIKSPIKLTIDGRAYDYLLNNYDDKTEVEIVLGTETCIGKTNNYKSIRTLFNDVCSVFPRKEKKDPDSKTVKIMTQDTERNVGEVEQTKTSELYPFSYIVKDGVTTKSDDGTKVDNGIEVIFYYKEPTKFRYCRVYDWGLTRNSIVKDLEINNKNEYASLASFSMYDKDNKEFTMEDIRNSSIGYKLKATNYTNDFILTNQVSENPNSSSRLRLKNAINESLINSLYEGSITIPGDPFYMFDDRVVPYCYPIKINVWRPSGRSENSSRIDSPGEPVLSYVSGYYVITSISHNINLSGFTTTLGIMKYPGIEDTLS